IYGRAIFRAVVDRAGRLSLHAVGGGGHGILRRPRWWTTAERRAPRLAGDRRRGDAGRRRRADRSGYPPSRRSAESPWIGEPSAPSSNGVSANCTRTPLADFGWMNASFHPATESFRPTTSKPAARAASIAASRSLTLKVR